jgi:ankyrin repeat protein
VELLLANGADVNGEKGGDPPLLGAAMDDHKDVAELLLAHKADVNARGDEGFTPLHIAAQWGHKDMVEWLLANGADVNTTNSEGDTPLGWTLKNGPEYQHPDVVELLRQHGGHE